ncbi:IclR family transcriptional regulator [Kribbella sp. NBC_01245]|uniref:IclR family transcriptional regulator n=1 Tax=Kribbella sp. NBC_01245 TaxID=2903578 RepID=UPI002E2E6385|nr:IclR family transcriptional regulator [Kribbella sp. NBC_01245]
MSSADVTPVKSAERTVHILETLAASPVKLTLAQLQERMGYPRSSLHALIRTLRELKWIEADESGSAFGIGPQALVAGTSYLERDPALDLGTQTLEDLRAEIGCTAHYARRDDADVLYLASREARTSTRMVSRVGRKLPASVTALGQVLLAQLTPAELDKLLPAELPALTPASITSKPELYAELEAIRSRGWSLEKEQGTPGIACIAVAVEYRIPATDAVSCSFSAEKATDAEVERIASALVRHVSGLGTTLRRRGIR